MAVQIAGRWQMLNKLSGMKRIAFTFLMAHGEGTAREVAAGDILVYDMLHKRLPELARDGLVQKAGRKMCPYTKKLAIVWKPAIVS